MENTNFARVMSATVAKVLYWLTSTTFILWGWNVLAPHLNAPLFSFWEMFAIRMAFTYFTSILWQKAGPKLLVEEEE